MRLASSIACQFAAALLALVAAMPLAAQTDPAIPSETDAPIAMLVDLSSGQVLHARNIDRRFMPASITKVMTAYVAFGLLDNGGLEPNRRLPYSSAAHDEWGGQGSTMFLNAGDTPRVADLLLGITTVSANDASVVLAEGLAGSVNEWANLMNAAARDLGMSNSRFGTPNGWPDEGRTFTTARDLAVLAEALIRQYPESYRRYFGHREFTYRGIKQSNYEPFTGRLKGGDGIKTGFTNEAGFGVVGSAERDGRRLILVLAGAGSNGIRARAGRAYMEWGFSHFASKRLFAPGEIIGSARVQGGSDRHVDLMTRQMIAAAMPRGSSRNVKLAITYNGPVRAPVMAGDQIAELEITVEGMEPSRVPLYAAENVGTAGPLARMLNGIIGWFS